MTVARQWLACCAMGLLFAAIQLCGVIVLQQKPLDAAVARLVQWDSLHYLRIEEDGYYWRFGRGPYDPALVRDEIFDGTNVAFFPAYPLLSRVTKGVTGLTPELSLLLTSVLCSAGFWACVLALLRRWKVSRRLTIAAVIAVFTYPPSFFFVTAYSESLFALSMMVVILAYEYPARFGIIFGAIGGFVLGATRIFALPFCLYPLLRSASDALSDSSNAKRVLLRGCASCVAIAAGTFSFFVFTLVAFGHFDLYMHAQSVGWNVVPDPLLLLGKPLQVLFPFFTLNSEDGDYANKVGFAVMLWSCVGAAIAEWRMKAHGFGRRVPLYACALLIAVLAAVAEARNDFQSVLRYLLPSHVLLVLAVTHLAANAPAMSKTMRTGLWIAYTTAVIFAAACQYHLAWAFTHKIWIA